MAAARIEPPNSASPATMCQQHHDHSGQQSHRHGRYQQQREQRHSDQGLGRPARRPLGVPTGHHAHLSQRPELFKGPGSPTNTICRVFYVNVPLDQNHPVIAGRAGRVRRNLAERLG
jgi:hypothetical protein